MDATKAADPALVATLAADVARDPTERAPIGAAHVVDSDDIGSLVGATFGNYRVCRSLGQGGMGKVYEATHPHIGKSVAIKILHPRFSANPEMARRFFHEAKIVNDIGHKNIVDVIDYGEVDLGDWRMLYLIMQFVDGRSLSELLRSDGALPAPRVTRIASQLADALSAAHQHRVIHRDLKSQNIMCTERGTERDFVTLLDFGIAKLGHEDAHKSAVGWEELPEHARLTRTGAVLGTAPYMSPEQIEGEAVDTRTDIYSLGVVLYEMMTGRLPFHGTRFSDFVTQHLHAHPRPPSQCAANVDPRLEAIALKCLAKRRDDRYASMAHVLEVLDGLVD